MKDNNSEEAQEIYAEVIKNREHQLDVQISDLMEKVWEQKEIPRQWRKVIMCLS